MNDPEAVQELQELLESILKEANEKGVEPVQLSINEAKSTVTFLDVENDRTIEVPVKLCCKHHAVLSFLDNGITALIAATLTGADRMRMVELDLNDLT